MTYLKTIKFVCIFLFFSISTLISINFEQNINLLIGIGTGAFLTLFCIFLEKGLAHFNLLSFNATILGSFAGYFLGKTLVKTIDFLSISQENTLSVQLIKSSLMLSSIYLGVLFTIKNANEIYFNIPFVRIKHSKDQKKDLLLDRSILSDPRLIDLAATGLVDNRWIVPKCIIHELKENLESSNEDLAVESKRSLDVYKKLEAISHLNLRLTDIDFPEIEDSNEKMVQIAKHIHADIFTANIKWDHPLEMNTRMITIHSLSNALKPLMEMGKHLQIKIQRYGKEPRDKKEPRQGVGYLEDGTMVVVNGGGDFIGQTINALVLSVKHTSSGRMIFCNTLENSAYSKEEQVLSN